MILADGTRPVSALNSHMTKGFQRKVFYATWALNGSIAGFLLIYNLYVRRGGGFCMRDGVKGVIAHRPDNVQSCIRRHIV